MQTKSKLLFFVALMLLGLGIATTINVSLNFRDYSIKNAVQKATLAAVIVKDGLTAHMVNGIMEKRGYFLNQISTNNEKIKKLWIVRSSKVIKQYGKGFDSEAIRDAIDKKVLTTGKTVQKVTESAENSMLRITIPYNATIDENGPNCLACHHVNSGDTLGAISMEFDITDMRNAGIFTILKILALNLIFIIIVLFLINYYVTPYMKLFSDMQKGIKKAYRGDFSHKFTTSVSGDAKSIIDQLNTLFRKMQETFGGIKYNLATFIPQGCVSSTDPLQEAKIIIEELSDIYKFKKTIENDPTKEIVYSRIADVLKNKYALTHFAFYEVDTIKLTRKLIYISRGESICNDGVNLDASLCRAYRTNTSVISSEFTNLCQECTCNDLEYICIPFTINDANSFIISITSKNKSELNKINSYIQNIENYLEAAKPVVESKILMSKLRNTSLKDVMTGFYNRRFLDEFIDTVSSQAKREKTIYSILMLDVDYFKKINDTYGHDIGDKVIVKIGEVVRASIRESDLAIRYGGEEFVIILHNANDEGTLKIAKKIHSEFANLVFDVGNGQTVQKTMSIGIAKFPKDGDTIWKCIKHADTALYVAKTTGRNKIIEYKKEMSENDNLR